jgi:hypothetical protein
MASLAVLITYYNERELLTECLTSLFEDAGFQGEVRVWDDASNAPAHDYLGSFRDRVQVHRSETNQGPARARNALLALCQSDYAHFHDADDVFRKGWVQAVEGAIAKEPDWILMELDSTRDGAPYGKRFLGIDELKEHRHLVKFCFEHPVLPAAATYRTQFLREAGGYQEGLWQSEDYELHIRLAAKALFYETISQPFVEVRVRETSRSQKLQEVWLSRLQGLESLAAWLDSRFHSDLGEAFAVTGTRLFQLGCRREARKAFAWAARFGAVFRAHHWGYRLLAPLLGPFSVERLAAVYRTWIPSGVRRWARSQ